MNLAFRDEALNRLETDAAFHAAYGATTIKAFRKRVQYIRAARDERDFYAYKALRYEKLKGSRSAQRSMRLNDQWRLIVEVEERQDGRTVVIVGIEDYH